MKHVIVAYVRGRWVWLRIVRSSNQGATLTKPFLEWAEREGATKFTTMAEAQQWAPPGSSIMSETWAPRSARMGKS